MGNKTGIAWTNHSWNPWSGCTKVSPGCAHCYAEREHKRFGRNFDLVQRSKTTFNAPLKWKEPALVFTCSWSDFFHSDADAWRAEAWAIIRATPHLTYQILTKRPERLADHLPADWGTQGYANVWLGVSVENQRHMDRVALLSNVPATVRFVSAEPLLGPLNFSWPSAAMDYTSPIEAIDWVIVGGESGAKSRPMELDWVRAIRDTCQTALVPFFLKQLGGYPDARAHDKAVLDGQTHTEMPVMSHPTQAVLL